MKLKIDHDDLSQEKKEITKAGKLRWVHWVIVLLSLFITFIAWYFTKKNIEEKAVLQFDRQVNQVILLISERMQKYEDALWSAGATLQMKKNKISPKEWKHFSQSLNLEQKYPGIDGIGIVDYVTREAENLYIADQKKLRPNFNIHPPHSEEFLLPIKYIEPLAANQKALGLDLAFETNRKTAALKARDTGKAQITGPITLVQDQQKTPGFLFYAPIYKNNELKNKAQHQDNFLSFVYAPFVVHRLMEGTLKRKNRHVGIKITDGKNVIYNELTTKTKFFDPKPLFKKKQLINFYGRKWNFEISTDKFFRQNAESNQPTIILLAGITIDLLLLTLFLTLSRANRRAISYADKMTDGYKARTLELNRSILDLSRSNSDLENFAYAASHDLQEPLRMVASSCDLLKQKYADQFDEIGTEFLGFAISGAKRMQSLVDDILKFSRINPGDIELIDVDMNEILEFIKIDLKTLIAERNVQIISDPLPNVLAHESYIKMVLQNLIQNGIKFNKQETPVIKVTAKKENNHYVFSVSDNGIGIDRKFEKKIFDIFVRLHSKDDYLGTGIGLAMVRKIILLHDGNIWLEPQDKQTTGSTFSFTLPLT